MTPAVATQLTFPDSKPGFNSNCEGGGGVGVGVGVGVTVGVGVGVGVGDPPQPANLNEPIRVRQLLLPSEESGQYSGAVSYNVLEHIEDHVGALGSMRQLVRPGGKIVLIVPASRSR